MARSRVNSNAERGVALFRSQPDYQPVRPREKGNGIGKRSNRNVFFLHFKRVNDYSTASHSNAQQRPTEGEGDFSPPTHNLYGLQLNLSLCGDGVVEKGEPLIGCEATGLCTNSLQALKVEDSWSSRTVVTHLF